MEVLLGLAGILPAGKRTMLICEGIATLDARGKKKPPLMGAVFLEYCIRT